MVNIEYFLSSSQVDLVSFVQINPENYQRKPPLPEVVPEAHTDSSVHLTTFALLFCCIELLNPRLIFAGSCVGSSVSQTISDAREGTADEPAVESPRTRKWKTTSAGNSGR